MTSSDTAPSADGKLSGKRMVLLVAALMMCVLSYQLNSSMITPALPDIADSLGVSVNDVAQVSSLFQLFGSIGGICLTRWSDYIGRRNIIFLILGSLCIGTLLVIFAPSLPMVLVGRALQGLSSASFQISYLVLNEALDAKSFGVALGAITAINGGVGGVDGYIGGLLTEHFGFRSLFIVILVFAIIAAVSVVFAFPKNMKPSSTGRFDWWGGAFITVGIICLGQFVTSGSSADHGWSAPRTIVFLVVAAVALVLFWIRESRAHEPMISVSELKSRQVWPLIAGVLLTLAGVYAVINYTVIVFSQNGDAGYGMSASVSSLFFLVPPAVIGIVSAPFVGWMAPRVGWIRTLRIGLLICLVALALIALFPTNMVVVVACVAVLGVGYNGMALTTLNGLGVVLSPEASKGSLPAVSGACFGLGSGIGVALVSPFASAGTVTGFRTAMIISIIITALAFAASMAMRAAEGQQS